MQSKRKIEKKSARQTIAEKPLSLTSANYKLFALAILVLIAGYVFLSIGPAKSFWSLTLAPIVLVIGYCVLIPLAIFFRGRKSTSME